MIGFLKKRLKRAILMSRRPNPHICGHKLYPYSHHSKELLPCDPVYMTLSEHRNHIDMFGTFLGGSRASEG